MRDARIALGVVLLAAAPAGAQDFSGTWTGRISCEAAGNLAAINSPITLTVANGVARYERPLRSPADASRILATEIAEGPVGPDGTVRMTGSVTGQGWRQDGNWSGKMSRPATVLGGGITTTNSTVRSGIERRCTLNLRHG
jgi:hypothetical protein